MKCFSPCRDVPALLAVKHGEEELVENSGKQRIIWMTLWSDKWTNNLQQFAKTITKCIDSFIMEKSLLYHNLQWRQWYCDIDLSLVVGRDKYMLWRSWENMTEIRDASSTWHQPPCSSNTVGLLFLVWDTPHAVQPSYFPRLKASAIDSLLLNMVWVIWSCPTVL